MSSAEGSWVDRWRDLLGGPDSDAARRRCTQGRAFQRSGRVGTLRITPGRLVGQVQGARATPFLIEVIIPTLDDRAWTTLIELTATTARHSARLFAGQLSEELTDELGEQGIALFAAPEEVDARCACGEASRPCAHVVALWEEAAAVFADDPFTFLRLRGRGRSQLMAELGAVRRSARGSDTTPGVQMQTLRGAGWSRSRRPLERVVLPPAAPPETVAGPLRLLGDPPGWAGSISAVDLFGPMVVDASDHAGRLLDPPDEDT